VQDVKNRPKIDSCARTLTNVDNRNM